MKKIFVLTTLFFVSVFVFAQVPDAMKYQTILRDNYGMVIQNKAVALKISILSTSPTGTVVYSERQQFTTNDYGLVSLNIGKGSVLSGSFTTIDWSTGDYFMKVEIDIAGGTNYIVMGTSQLLSVPFAKYADIAGKSANDYDTSAVNEFQNLNYTSSTRTLDISSGIGVTIPLFSTSNPGLVNSSGGGTTNFLRADGTWTAPAGANYDAGSGITLTGGTFSHTAHSGDATGSTSITIVGLQGRSVAAAAPLNSEVLKWNGSAWAPAADNNTSFTAGTGITLSGNTFSANNTAAMWNANQLQGYSISTTAPSNSEVLKWNGSAWAPAADNSNIYAAGSGITLSANTFSHTPHSGDAIGSTSLTVVALQGNSVSTVAPANTQVLKWNGSTWAPADDNSAFYSAGTGLSLTGSIFANTGDLSTTNEIQNLSYTAGSRTININLGGTGTQLPYFSTISSDAGLVAGSNSGGANVYLNGSGTWSSPPGSSYDAGTGIALSSNSFSHKAHTGDAIGATSLTVVALQGVGISSTAPTTTQLLRYNGTNWIPSDETAYAAGTGINLTANTIFNTGDLSAVNELQHLSYTAGTRTLGITTGTGVVLPLYTPSEPGLVPASSTGSALIFLNGAGAWTAPYTAGTGITLSSNSFSHKAHTGDAVGATSLTVVAIQGRSVVSTAPTNGDILAWNGSAWVPATAFSNYTTGSGLLLLNNTFSALNSSAIWNANQLNGTSISTIAPSNSQLLKWNGSQWFPTNEVAYSAGTGITLSANTFSHTAHTGDATGITSLTVVAIQGRPVVTAAPAASEILKWNGSAWAPAVDDKTIYSAGTGLALTGSVFSISGPIPVSLGGTGQTVVTNGQLLIGNASGTLTKNQITAGSGISITNGDGSITIDNSNPNQNHSGDATGSSSLTVVALRGRSIATATPSTGSALVWNGTEWAMGTTTDAFNGNRTIKRPTWPYGMNMVTSTNVVDFLNAVFFPFLSATLSINGNVLYEIGTTNTVNISGSTTKNDETIFSLGRIDKIYPGSPTQIYAFGSATTYSTSVSFNPTQVVSTQDDRYRAYQTVDNNGSPVEISSGVKLVQACYPFLYGVSSTNLTSGGTALYSAFSPSGKIIQGRSNKTVTFSGSLIYFYFCYPASYGSLTDIIDQNNFSMMSIFTRYTANVTSVGLPNNWTESYYIYQSNSVTSTTGPGWVYQFKY